MRPHRRPPTAPRTRLSPTVLLAMLAWLVLATGLNRALVVCTGHGDATHLTLAHAHGSCAHDDGVSSHTHEHAHGAAKHADHEAPSTAPCPDDCTDRSLACEPSVRPDRDHAPERHAPPALLAMLPPLLRALTRGAEERDERGPPLPLAPPRPDRALACRRTVELRV